MVWLLALLWQFPAQALPLESSLAGKVVWQGGAPTVAPFRAPVSPGVGQPDPALKTWANPLAPKVAADGGLAGVLVWVEGPAPKTRPPVRVVVRDNQIQIQQGEKLVPVGLLQVGDSITVESQQGNLFTLRARGISSFAIPLVEQGKAVTRKLNKAGWMELSSGSGQYWARAWLWVGAPALATFTDDRGNFDWQGLQPGKVSVYARLPDWRVTRMERDQETGEILLANYGPPRKHKVEVDLKSGEKARVEMAFKADQR